MKGAKLYKHIRSVGLRRLLWPLLPMLFAVITINWIPFKEIIHPMVVNSTGEAIEAVEDGHKYLQINIDQVVYSGYNYMKDEKIYGEYYYDLVDDKTCLFYLFDPIDQDVEQYLLEDVHRTVKVVDTDGIFDNMLEMFSNSIDWTYDGVNEITKDYVLTEKGYNKPMYIAMFCALVALFVYGAALFAYNMLLILMPWMSPKILYAKLKREKSLFKMDRFVGSVVDEMENVEPIGNGMYITKHYFLDLSKSEFTIVPLDEIKMAYEHGTLKTFLGLHLAVTYTLHLKCSNIVRFHAPRKKLSDVHAVLDYLRENRPEILIGYTSENRKLFKRILKSSTKWFRSK